MGSDDLHGKVALVTGAAYGLGRAIAADLARRGASVVLTDIDGRLGETEAAFQDEGLVVSSTRIDVRDRASFRDGVAQTLARHGRFDILVNNAGYSRTSLSILDMDLDEWELSMQINMRAVLFGIQEAAPAMIAGGRGGRVINIASTAGFRPYRYKAPYCVSKSGVIALTRVAALELAEHRITVNAVAPGQTDTETTRVLWDDPAYGDAMKRRADAAPLGIGKPEDIASTVLFLAGEGAGHITGQTILVDGGTLLA